MTSRQFEISLEDLAERASDTVKPKLTEVEEKYKEFLRIANDAVVVTMEMRHRAGRLYSELSGVAETSARHGKRTRFSNVAAVGGFADTDTSGRVGERE